MRGAVGFWVDVEGERSRTGWVGSAERVGEREEETPVGAESRALAQAGWVKVPPSTEQDSWWHSGIFSCLAVIQQLWVRVQNLVRSQPGPRRC